MGLNDLNIYNNQFSLEYYLNTNLGNSQIIEYAKSNKLNINYTCFVSTIVDKIHYILTSSIRFVTIEYSETDDQIIDYRQFNKDNFIMLAIYYQNICIKISQQYDTFNSLTSKIPNYDILKPLFISRKTLKGEIAKGNNLDFDIKHNHTTYSSEIISCKNVLKLNHLFLLKNMSNLKTLIFAQDFNHYINPNLIPQSVIKIDFGYNFNQSLDQNVLPPNLVELRMSNMYNGALTIDTFTSCCNSLTTLTLYDNVTTPFSTIKYLKYLKHIFLPSINSKLAKKIRKELPLINIDYYYLKK